MSTTPPYADVHRLLARNAALIFDFDGTIAETNPLHARAFEETLAPLGVTADYPSIAGLRTQEAILHCLRTEGRSKADFDLPALVAEKQRRARKLIAEQLDPIPAVEAFLVRARSRFGMALVTSGSCSTVSIAQHMLGYDGWFDPIVCAEDVAHATGAGRLHQGARRHAVRPEQALVFEDTAFGFEAARAAGLAVVDASSLNWSNAVANI
jgi:HAD superfamily hydrolase (TIGR01509 family)